ncbi:MAG: DUF4097 family beta strand repeat-containing protein [Bacillota bacterium]
MYFHTGSIGRVVMVVFLAGLLSKTGCVSIWAESADFKETRNLTVAHQAGSPIRVATTNGAVSVQRALVAEVTIKAEIRAISEQRLADTRIIAERRDGALVVEVAWPDGQRKGSEGCSFEISVPDAKDADVRTGNGSITLTGLAGKAYARTSNGSITITGQDGSVDADTSNGAIRIKAATGELIAKTSNGGIEIEDATGHVEASTNNSRIKVRLADSNPGPVQLHTSNGSIDLAVGKGFVGELKMSTVNGSVNFSAPANAKEVNVHKNSARLVIGENKHASEVHTSNGSIHFTGLEK